MENEILLKKVNYLLNNFRSLPKYNKIQLPLTSLVKFKNIPFSIRDDLKNYDIPSTPSWPLNITATSGSTKSKLIVFHSLNCYNIHLKRQITIYSSIGIKNGDCCLNLCSYSLNGAARIMENAMREIGVTVIPLGEISNENKLNEAIDLIAKLRPNIINSYVNQIYEIFDKIGKKHTIEKCILNGEPLFASFKNQLENISGTKIYNNYGSMEFSGFAIAKNPQDAYLRMFENGLFIEVLKKNGKTNMLGKGKIVITDLNNYAMPFIRYILGDQVEIKQLKNNKVIKILGRSDNYILIHGEVESKREIVKALFKLLGHPNFSFLIFKDKQTYKDKIILNIFAQLNKSASLTKIIKQRLPFITSIRISNRKIPRTPTGKFRNFIDSR